MKKIILILVFILLTTNLSLAVSYSPPVEDEVEVTIPQFPVVLNEVAYDSSYATYPLINYKGITYFPMTWNLGRALGLSTSYTQADGLSIKLGNPDGTLSNTPGAENDTTKSYKALTAAYDIAVNGKMINNASEEFPILNFRGVTYFPLTWRFAHDEFNWNYTYSNVSGLNVGSTVSDSSTGSTPSNIPDKTKEMVLNWNIGFNIQTLDPGLNTAVNTGVVINNVFEGLMREVDGKPVYAMADSHTVSEDGLVYSFHIRDSAKWSDGKAVTAYDFEYAWNRNTDPATASDYAWLFYEFNYESCEAVDDSTFKVTLSSPADYFLGMTSFSILMPLRQEAVEANGTWASDPDLIISNGPFRLTEYVTDDKIVLTKNELYWKADEVQIDKIVAKMFAEASDALAEYEAGALDLNAYLPINEVPRLLDQDPTFRIESRPGTYYINLNAHNVEEMQDLRVRQALSLVIDRVDITKGLNGGNIPAINFIPPGIKDANGEEYVEKALDYGIDINDMSGNIKKAKQLLSEAGYPNGEGFPVIQYIINNGEGHILIALKLKEAFKTHLGIDLEILVMDWGVFQEFRRNHDFQLARGGWIGDYVDPLTFIGFYITGSSLNSPDWSNEEFDALIKASTEATGQERYDMLAEAEKVLVEDAWFIPLYNFVDTIHQKDYLKGLERTVYGNFFFGRAYLEN